MCVRTRHLNTAAAQSTILRWTLPPPVTPKSRLCEGQLQANTYWVRLHHSLVTDWRQGETGGVEMHHQLLRPSRPCVAFCPGGCAHELRQGVLFVGAQATLHGSGSGGTLLIFFPVIC
jgi:hypothetical protein